MKKVLIWIWCFPQMLIGFLLRIFTTCERRGDHYWYVVKSGSISLGEYIFLCPEHWIDQTVLNHERGHRKQSRILGWLYLPVIGIPSVVWASCFAWYRRKYKVSYYAFYTERWADMLGGVNRYQA